MGATASRQRRRHLHARSLVSGKAHEDLRAYVIKLGLTTRVYADRVGYYFTGMCILLHIYVAGRSMAAGPPQEVFRK